MDWKIDYDAETWIAFHWSEYHQADYDGRKYKYIAALFQVKEERKEDYKNYTYHIEGNDSFDSFVQDTRLPENTLIDDLGDIGKYRIYTDSLDTALEIIEDFKRITEEKAA